MKKRIYIAIGSACLLIIIILMIFTAKPAVKNKLIVGYYASWAAYDGYTPLNIPASKLTHINYAFANISKDLKITLGDAKIDPRNFEELKQLKANYPHIKILITIGGWTWSDRFSDVALTEQSRAAFAESVAAFIKQYGFDGVDLDWEYPVSGGLASNKTRKADKENFTLLIIKLREILDEQGSVDGKHYLLTFAGGESAAYTENTQLGIISDYVDYATIMTYDIHGAYDDYTDFNAPLYIPSENSPQFKWSCDAAVNLWVNNGFPASKIVMGIPFYGVKFEGVKNRNNGLYQTFTKSGSIPYDEIVSVYLINKNYKRFLHENARVPWLFNGKTFISYDDLQSISEKAAYIREKNLRGAAIWDLSQNADGTLLDGIYNSINKK